MIMETVRVMELIDNAMRNLCSDKRNINASRGDDDTRVFESFSDH